MRFETNDPVKGVGFVPIYFAYLEDSLDALIRTCTDLFTVPDEIFEKWTFRKKPKWLRNQLAQWLSARPDSFGTYSNSDFNFREEIESAGDVLEACNDAAQERNSILHRPFWGGPEGLRRKQRGGEETRVDVDGLCHFAEHVAALNSRVASLDGVIGRLVQRGPDATTPAAACMTRVAHGDDLVRAAVSTASHMRR